MDSVTPQKNESAFLRWQRQRRWIIGVLGASPLLLMFVLVYPFFFIRQAQVPEALVLVTQVQERQVPEKPGQEIRVPESQVVEIQPGMLEIRVPLTQVQEGQVPEKPEQEGQMPEKPEQEGQKPEIQVVVIKPETQVVVIEPETQVLRIKVPEEEVVKIQWLKRQVPEIQVVEIQVPVTQLRERLQPETQWLAIHVPVAQLHEIQPETQVLVTQMPVTLLQESKTLFYLIVGIFIAYAAVPIVYQQRVMKPRLRRLSKDAAVFAALVAVEDLQKGDPVRASLSMDKLLLALSDLLEQKSVALGMSAVPPGDLMHVTPGKIPRRAVFRAIQANEDTKDFQERLCDLASGLHSNEDTGYLAAHKFLVWLDQKTESYHKATKSFFEKHPTLKTVIVYLGPAIATAIGGIVVVVLQMTTG